MANELDYKQAITAHSSWKMKLSNYLAKPDGSLKVETVASDSLCDLGIWLREHAAQHPEIHSLHKRFHLAASDVVKRANEGKSVSEEVTLGGSSEFAKISTELVSKLMQLKQTSDQK